MSNTTPNAGPLTLLQAAEVARWYDELAPALRRFVAGALLHTTDDGQDVDDVIQETFLRLMAHLTELAALTPAHRRNYAWTTAKCVTRDRHRYTTRRLPAVPLSSVADAPMEPLTASHDWQAHATTMEQTTAARMSLHAVWQATPPHYRELLLLLAAGYTPAEMAARLGISQHGVAMRVWRLRQVLREAGERIA